MKSMKNKIFLFVIAVVLIISGVVLLAIAQPNETPPDDDVTPQFGEGCCCGTSIGIVCIGATTFLLYKKKKGK